jgi:hypothetical protein
MAARGAAILLGGGIRYGLRVVAMPAALGRALEPFGRAPAHGTRCP